MVNFIGGSTPIYAPASARPDLGGGRIIRETKRERAEEHEEATQADEGTAKGDNYLSALVKLIPSEMIYASS
ncbi:hypothetical protein GA0061098_10536 [Bradyrhizobium shewense]|uniref:Uncharacterized protein n=1 Tax=Bradyrhizobium shewense TaxID=1761772 RepID=A0A1C3XU25_9BRAD|nr:hypothetical protein [Bradyrhizobium shewense]SCB55763.1 hypothetical protein GA0061098_10536 [Bradyrhizobium shewense]